MKNRIMDYKRKIKKLSGYKTHKRLAYLYHILHHNNSMLAAMRTLSDNKRFREIHSGERCFILGNGPSLREVSLEWLKDEWVFTVNYFNKIPNYRAVKTNYHVWMDPIFWGGGSMSVNMKEVMECYDLIAKEDCECFFQLGAYSFLEEKGLLKQMKANFIYVDDELTKETKLKTDLSNIIALYSTVVQYAITIAIYMGFSEIYLLGCDSTFLLGMFDNLLKISAHNIHAYSSNDDEKQIEKLLRCCSMSEILQSQTNLFLGYEKLYEYCRERKIALVNCSGQTVVTSIPRQRLEKVLKR